MYWTRASNCCAEARAILDCDPVGPCRGFSGDCADLPGQFEAVPGSGFFPPGSYVCSQFPDPAKLRDKVITTLIMMAVALPTRMVISRLFEISNQVKPCGFSPKP